MDSIGRQPGLYAQEGGVGAIMVAPAVGPVAGFTAYKFAPVTDALPVVASGCSLGISVE